jgi:TRAP-type C4-dicarboxylate transport system permease small subunit
MANNLTAYFAPWALEAMTDASNEKKKTVAVCRWQCIEFCRCTPQYTAREKSQVKNCIRLLCAVPPIFLGAKFGSLTTIFTFAGLASFFLEFIFPAMFQRHSVQVLKDQSQAPSATQAEDGSRWWIDGARTVYSNVFSDRVFVFAALAFGSAAIAFTFLLSLLQLVAEKWLCANAPWACST